MLQELQMLIGELVPPRVHVREAGIVHPYFSCELGHLVNVLERRDSYDADWSHCFWKFST